MLNIIQFVEYPTKELLCKDRFFYPSRSTFAEIHCSGFMHY